MSVFEFLLALYSIVAGLGMSLLVRSVGQMIESRDRVRRYWVHTCLVGIAFIAQVVTWFSLWRFSTHSPWTILETLLLIVIPLLLYLVGHLTVPELEEGRNYDLRAYYFRHARWIQGLLLAVVLVSLLGEAYLVGEFEFSRPRMLRALLGVILIPGVLTLNPRVHELQTVLILLVILAGVSEVALPIG